MSTNTKLHLTKSLVSELLDQAIAERGEDYNYKAHYESCVYHQNGEPRCLVGVVLHKAGYDLNELDDYDNGLGFSSLASSYVFQEEGVKVDGDARRGLIRAQRTQDSGGTWGEARKAFHDASVVSDHDL